VLRAADDYDNYGKNLSKELRARAPETRTAALVNDA
jgi:hypothetical protein